MATTLYNNINISHFSLQNIINFSQDFSMTSPNNNYNNNTTNLCPLPPQIYDSNNNNGFSQQQQQQQQQRVSYPWGYTSSSAFSNSLDNSLMNNSSGFSQSFSSLLDKHRQDIDTYLHFQGEKLKEALQQQKKQQMALLLSRYQSRSMALLREKEENLEKIRVKTKMLEEYLKKKEEEKQVWQRVAKEKEEMVTELSNMLVLIKQNYGNLVPGNGVKIDDVESVYKCESLNNGGGNNEGKSHEFEGRKRGCKWCNAKEMSVVFLPCRHLCCCKECDSLLDFCLVCHNVKQGSIEILLS